jgi:hypothetical protein
MDQSMWLSAPGHGEIRPADVPAPADGEVLVRTLFSAVSRGTELLVFRGLVPANQYGVMRAPFQEGDFPAPVKYGYLNVGVVEQGPAELRGRTVFCLYPHQTRYVVPAAAVTVVPDGVPAARAVLAGTVETAVNAAWDAAPLVGDRIAVVGAGMVGACVAKILSGIPATRVQLVDVNPDRAAVAARLGVGFATPEYAADGCDLVVHASATEAGLARSLELLAPAGGRAAGGVVSLAAVDAAVQPGGHDRTGSPRPARLREPAGDRPRSARRPGVRGADHRRMPVRRVARHAASTRRG